MRLAGYQMNINTHPYLKNHKSSWIEEVVFNPWTYHFFSVSLGIMMLLVLIPESLQLITCLQEAHAVSPACFMMSTTGRNQSKLRPNR